MKRLALLAVLVAGCTRPSPVPTVDDIQPLIAVAGTYSVLASSTAAPEPPAPVQGDVCPACYGRGIVGDGTNMMKCQRCDGTGKIVKHPPVVIHPADCKDGKCQTPKSTSR